jgi:hypothetical protein
VAIVNRLASTLRASEISIIAAIPKSPTDNNTAASITSIKVKPRSEYRLNVLENCRKLAFIFVPRILRRLLTIIEAPQ